MLVDDSDLIEISDFSKNTRDNTGLFGDLTMFESSVSHVSHDDFDLFKQKAKKACIGKPIARQRERERLRKEEVLQSVLQSRCHRKVDGTILGVILFRLSEHSILMDETSENTLNEELTKLFLVKIQFKENYTRLSTRWRSRIWNEEIQNLHYSSHSVSLDLNDVYYWKPINLQIKLNVREYTRVADWRCRIIFIKNAMQEVAEKLKNFKKRCYQEENTEKKQRRLEEFRTQHVQESRTSVSILLRS